MKFATTALLASLSVSAAVATSLPLLRVRSSDGNFVDNQGRVVLLRGINIASKVPDFKIVQDNNYAKFVQPLVDLGYNAVRLVFNLEAYATSPTTRNLQYLAQYIRLVAELGARDIYTIVDFHQDLFSRWSINGCGEGFPQYWVDSALQATPANQSSVEDLYRKACKTWGLLSVLDQNVAATFASLYNSTGPVQANFITLLREVTLALKAIPTVVAYDIINEPRFSTNPLTDVIPLYRRAANAIQSINPQAIVLYAQTLSGSLTPSELLPNPNITNSVYTSHLYDARKLYFEIGEQLSFWFTQGPFLADISAKFAAGASLPATVAIVAGAVQDAFVPVKMLYGIIALLALFPLDQFPGGLALVAQLQSALDNFAGALTVASASFATPWSAATITNLVTSLNVLAATVDGVLIQAIIPIVISITAAPDAAAFLAPATSLSKSYGSAYVLGEFGTPLDTPIVNTDFVNQVNNAADSLFVSTFQWGYFPYWSPTLKDGWNLEDYSIIDNQGNFRSNLQAYRPYVPVTDGTPISLNVSYESRSLTYTYQATGRSTTRIFFNASKLCNRARPDITVSDQTVAQCSANGAYVRCNTRRTGPVTVTVSC